MNNVFLKLAVLSGIAYLWYKYYYLPNQNNIANQKNNQNNFDVEDGRTFYYGKSKDEYVSGFPMPSKITDIKSKKIFILTKPNEFVFGVNPRGLIEVELLKDTNRIVYQARNKESYIAEYDNVKDKIVMLKDYTK